MEISVRELMSMLHGMLFGGFFLMAVFGAIVMLVDGCHPSSRMDRGPRWQSWFLVTMVVLGWAAVLSGAYIVYPWYRAIVPAGADLALYPKFFLTAHPSTAGWHNLGMEWKEHVAWIAPMAATMVAFVLIRHRSVWNAYREVRNAVVAFTVAAFLAAMIAGGWGTLIDKAAPIHGGDTIHLERSAR